MNTYYWYTKLHLLNRNDTYIYFVLKMFLLLVTAIAEVQGVSR